MSHVCVYGKPYLLHCERVDDFAAVVGQLCGLVRGDNGDDPGGGYFSWVGSEDTIDLLPYLKFRGFEPNC